MHILSIAIFCILICTYVAVSINSNKNCHNVEEPNDMGNLKYLKSQVSPTVQQKAAQLAMKRILGSERSSEILLQVDPSLTPSEYSDAFTVSCDGNSDGIITITGTTGVASLYGLNDYLQHHCSCLIVWEGSQLNLPPKLPRVNYKKTIVDRFRYYQNVCTESYSFVWWDWARWEKEIDWMALHGINMPLAFTGQEEIWRRVYLKLGLSQEDILNYISGPAFLAWWRMGNINKFGGPIGIEFLVRKLDLLHKIVTRMRNLGMIPVLPAFAGNVPPSIVKIFPNASLIEHHSWNHFNKSCSTFMLVPTDPLFKEIGQRFLSELVAEVGTNHIYSCDTFNENDPSKNSTTFLKTTAQATFEAMTIVDSKAVWMMQSWVFHAPFWQSEQVSAYLSGVGLGNALILDLEAERRPLYAKFNNFYGHSFLWCMLQNYGGTMNLYGALDLVNDGVSFTRKNVSDHQFVGIGSCPEGINQNSVMFEFLHTLSLQLDRVNLTEWINKYSDRRYGTVNAYLQKAWRILKNGPYNASKEFDNHGYSIVTKRPALRMSEKFWYNVQDIRKVVGYFIKALNRSESLKSSKLYKHDLVDFTRQFLEVLMAMNYKGLLSSYRKQRFDKFSYYSTLILKTLDDLEIILGTNENFLLGRWVNASESWSESSRKDKMNLRYNGLNQITLWGPTGEISDYAAKFWAGSMKFYYTPRWQLFISTLNSSLITGEPFNSKEFRKNVLNQIEIPFTFTNQTFSTIASGDSIVEARRIYENWNKTFSELYLKFGKHVKSKRLKAII